MKAKRLERSNLTSQEIGGFFLFSRKFGEKQWESGETQNLPYSYPRATNGYSVSSSAIGTISVEAVVERNGTAIGATAANTASATADGWRNWWRMPSPVRGMPDDLNGGSRADGVRVPYVPIAADVAAGAGEQNPHPPCSGSRYRSYQDPASLRSLQGDTQCSTWSL